VSLEKRDLGTGAGVVDGAFAELPRYFADANKVMDLETRLMWCMEKLQGMKHEDLVKRPHPAGGQPVKDLGAIATYVATKSSGMKYAAKLDKPQEKAVVAEGHAIFYRRQGPHDFSCATCHNDSGKRIRLQGLPYLADPKEAKQVIGQWPAYRVSTRK
jgi:sulfur-oxidizing protein SoxA